MSSAKDEPEEILDDLESIRDLLHEDDDAHSTTVTGERAAKGNTATSRGGTADEEIPVLQDVVDGTFELDESPLTAAGNLQSSDTGVFSTETINALLGDEWKDSADEILSEARSTIEESKEQWSPQDTSELTEALKIRIDATIDAWLADVLNEKIADLRARLQVALREETKTQVNDQLGLTDGK